MHAKVFDKKRSGNGVKKRHVVVCSLGAGAVNLLGEKPKFPSFMVFSHALEKRAVRDDVARQTMCIWSRGRVQQVICCRMVLQPSKRGRSLT
jgi:hypothetical protein